MQRQILLTGDVNLMKVEDPRAPFARVAPTLRAADFLFGNLEWVQKNMSTIIWALIIVPGLLALLGAWRTKRAKAVPDPGARAPMPD